jgi:hypothetical protein
MNSADPAAGLDPVSLQHVLRAVQDQVAAALWLSAGMLCAFGLIALLACGWRRSALVCGLLYSCTLCFVPNGHARILGPCGAAVAFLGLLRPAVGAGRR